MVCAQTRAWRGNASMTFSAARSASVVLNQKRGPGFSKMSRSAQANARGLYLPRQSRPMTLGTLKKKTVVAINP